MITAKVKNEVLKRLESIERNHDVTILFAIESGSRAWGFASPNSDYDIRFIYKHRPEWYKSLYLEEQRDVIECKIVDEIDLSGWDVRKALRLFGASNPSFIEWIQSPIQYVNDGYFKKECIAMLPIAYSATSGYYHYRNMATADLRNYLKEDRVRLKKYLYVMRALLARRYIVENMQPPPLPIKDLFYLLDKTPIVKQELIKLVERKASCDEIGTGDHIKALDEFIEKEIFNSYELQPIMKNPAAKPLLNQLYKTVVYGNE
jgi:hypothetical protein